MVWLTMVALVFGYAIVVSLLYECLIAYCQFSILGRFRYLLKKALTLFPLCGFGR